MLGAGDDCQEKMEKVCLEGELGEKRKMGKNGEEMLGWDGGERGENSVMDKRRGNGDVQKWEGKGATGMGKNGEMVRKRMKQQGWENR